VEKTALAEAEVEYDDIVSTQIDVAFEIVEAPNAPELVGAHAVIWTTTPWTIPVNQALAYGPEVEYTLLQIGGKRWLIAEALVETFLKRLAATNLAARSFDWDGGDLAASEDLRSLKGSDLAGAV
ncbi:class I tRNA ligase family protein, partial [Escherichia coli]